MAAQYRAAEAAEASSRTAWNTYIWTIFGVVLLFGTLGLTAWTLSETKNATTAAWGAARSAERAASDQVAPFIDIKNLRAKGKIGRTPFFPEPNAVCRYTATYDLKNVGKSIAHNVRCHARVKVKDISNGQYFDSWWSLGEISEGDSKSENFILADFPSNAEVAIPDGVVVIITIRCVYCDVFGVWRFTEADFSDVGQPAKKEMQFFPIGLRVGRVEDDAGTVEYYWKNPPEARKA